MTTTKVPATITRDVILKLLSDDELAKVSSAEDGAAPTEGDEYVDLEALELGVRKVGPAPTTVSRLLPRSAVRDETWWKICAKLAPPPRL
jgi:hypothetical protein